ncbi:MAG TPA: hypothetical protein VFV80_02885 [Geminicoccaceae bacterium]|nr:hypothetical protein [Geminicoccaceae bacterium]
MAGRRAQPTLRPLCCASLRPARLAGVALCAWLGACAARTVPPEPAIPPPPPAARATAPAVEPHIPPAAFCGALTALIEAERDGFAGLRGERLGSESWAGRRTLPGTKGCVVEGDAWPRARYACAGPPVQADQADRAEGQFARLSAQVDTCLGKPEWQPRVWHRHAPFEFAMGERQQTWTDPSTLPPSAVVLKLQRDLSGDDYRVTLGLATIR